MKIVYFETNAVLGLSLDGGQVQDDIRSRETLMKILKYGALLQVHVE